MPQYANSPFQVPILVMKGVAAYLYGTFNAHQGNTKMLVSQVALTSDVATLTVQITSGEIPAVGSLISVTQTVTGSGEFNVSRVPLTAVSITATTGAGTVSFALTASNVSATADAGTAIVEVPEVPETIAEGSSIPCVIQAPDGDSQFTVPYAVSFPTIPTAATVSLQAALKDNDAEYTDVQSPVAVVSGGAVTSGGFGQISLQRAYLYRFNVTGLSGSGTIVAKIGG